MFHLGTLFMDLCRNLRAQLRHQRLAMAKKYSALEVAAQASVAFAVFGSFAFIARQTMQGKLTIGDLVMYYQAFQQGQDYLRQVISGSATLYENNLYLSYLYEFLGVKKRIAEPSNPKPFPCPIRTCILLEEVSFRYPNSSRKALKDVTMRIPAGELVALVGENGSGKSTLIKLLCRLYDPTSGSIRIDGTDLRLFETAALRHEIAAVFQDFVRYNLTAGENIRLGNIESSIGAEHIVVAAQRAGIHGVISELPQGYDTILGNFFHDGEELSIGEWQKVALARAFLRKAQLIVLDEPTSGMDAAAEYQVFGRIRSLLEGRTGIIISHRFSTVRMADRIYVLADGRIIESGCHDELIAHGGKYAEMFEMQAEAYY